jgi:hypothetical protein
MKSNGYAENTLKTTDYKLRQIARQCDINNPEQVKAYIASLQVTNATKHKLRQTKRTLPFLSTTMRAPKPNLTRNPVHGEPSEGQACA